MNKRKKMKGFTLVELMIVVAIIAIISAIAYPSYQNSTLKTRRSDGKVALNDYSVQLERCFTMSGTYLGTLLNPCQVSIDLQTAAGKVSTKGFYRVNILPGNITASTFTLTATPIGSQVADTRCNALTLTNVGVKSFTGTQAHDVVGTKECT